ncbi:hypothetical protein CDAR_547791 [Caerostris darwini]|uniref:Uncharacterized protein n=1 Tax=Caerostris darwini TaxID=1538125 RepID=A0AAV4WFU2_9ARAC|nr:hypothetical protein CDAR_547791 [Caerostris darwini]
MLLLLQEEVRTGAPGTEIDGKRASFHCVVPKDSLMGRKPLLESSSQWKLGEFKCYKSLVLKIVAREFPVQMFPLRSCILYLETEQTFFSGEHSRRAAER